MAGQSTYNQHKLVENENRPKYYFQDIKEAADYKFVLKGTGMPDPIFIANYQMVKCGA